MLSIRKRGRRSKVAAVLSSAGVQCIRRKDIATPVIELQTRLETPNPKCSYAVKISYRRVLAHHTPFYLYRPLCGSLPQRGSANDFRFGVLVVHCGFTSRCPSSLDYYGGEVPGSHEGPCAVIMSHRTTLVHVASQPSFFQALEGVQVFASTELGRRSIFLGKE